MPVESQPPDLPETIEPCPGCGCYWPEPHSDDCGTASDLSQPPAPQGVARKGHFSELRDRGDYLIVVDSGGRKAVILLCPMCGCRMFCPHNVVCEEPLTLSPSVVGPQSSWDKVQGPCGHHFFIREGRVQ